MEEAEKGVSTDTDRHTNWQSCMNNNDHKVREANLELGDEGMEG
jgi:hypothetical protein